MFSSMLSSLFTATARAAALGFIINRKRVQRAGDGGSSEQPNHQPIDSTSPANENDAFMLHETHIDFNDIVQITFLLETASDSSSTHLPSPPGVSRNAEQHILVVGRPGELQPMGRFGSRQREKAEHFDYQGNPPTKRATGGGGGGGPGDIRLLDP